MQKASTPLTKDPYFALKTLIISLKKDETCNSFILIPFLYKNLLLYIILMQINKLSTLTTLVYQTL